MGSLPKGILRVLAWFDSTADELKALVNDNGRMPVSIDEQNVSLDAQSLVYDGSAWVKSPIPWGYTDRWVEQIHVANATAGTNVLTATAVPAGYVYVLQGLNTLNINSASHQNHEMILSSLVCRLALYSDVSLGVDSVTFPIGSMLKAGDTARGVFYSCTLNDDLYMRLWGYKMKVNM